MLEYSMPSEQNPQVVFRFKEFQRFPAKIQLVGKQVATLSAESQKITAKIRVSGDNLIKQQLNKCS